MCYVALALRDVVVWPLYFTEGRLWCYVLCCVGSEMM